MLKLGEKQKLQVVKKVDFGIYLAEREDDETRVLLPKKQVPEGIRIGDELTVFLYKDSKDRLISTLTEPKLTLGGLAVLKVGQVGKIGAFLDWGLEKDLFLPYKEQTKRVQEDAQLMEQMLIAEQTADRKEFGRLLKDLRQMQNNFDHEFLVSKEDQEFHSTYDTILRLGMKALNAPDQKLLLQSETENLLALLKENLEKEEPKIEALTFYYQLGSDQELAQLPPAEKLEKITYFYEREFRQPILQLLENGISRAGQLKDIYEAATDRASRKKYEMLQVLFDGQPEHILEQLMEE